MTSGTRSRPGGPAVGVGPVTLFVDRQAAGRALAAAVVATIERLAQPVSSPLVLGLARGGLPVGFEVAAALDAELDVAVVRKIGAPRRPELALGAVAEDEQPLLDRLSLAEFRVLPQDLGGTVRHEIAELRRRTRRYRGGRPAPRTAGRTVVVVDDGLATGLTAHAALRSLARNRPRQILLGVPVGSPDAVRRLAGEADAVVCLRQPEPFIAVSLWYEEFPQACDAEVVELLELARTRRDPEG